jgi:hypothetical protein
MKSLLNPMTTYTQILYRIIYLINSIYLNTIANPECKKHPGSSPKNGIKPASLLHPIFSSTNKNTILFHQKRKPRSRLKYIIEYRMLTTPEKTIAHKKHPVSSPENALKPATSLTLYFCSAMKKWRPMPGGVPLQLKTYSPAKPF